MIRLAKMTYDDEPSSLLFFVSPAGARPLSNDLERLPSCSKITAIKKTSSLLLQTAALTFWMFLLTNAARHRRTSSTHRIPVRRKRLFLGVPKLLELMYPLPLRRPFSAFKIHWVLLKQARCKPKQLLSAYDGKYKWQSSTLCAFQSTQSTVRFWANASRGRLARAQQWGIHRTSSRQIFTSTQW